MLPGLEVGVGSGDRGEPALAQPGDGLRERYAVIWVLARAAVLCPPTGVDRELHQVGEPSDLLRPCRLAALQRPERIHIDRRLPPRAQICVQESEMGELVIGV